MTEISRPVTAETAAGDVQITGSVDRHSSLQSITRMSAGGDCFDTGTEPFWITSSRSIPAGRCHGTRWHQHDLSRPGYYLEATHSRQSGSTRIYRRLSTGLAGDLRADPSSYRGDIRRAGARRAALRGAGSRERAITGYLPG